VPAADRSLVALLGASPGASTAVFIATEVLRTCFADRLTEDGRLPALRRLIPTYGIDLTVDADACLTSAPTTPRSSRSPICEPMRLCYTEVGQEWSGYAHQIRDALARIRASEAGSEPF
jgi:Malate:quinone oxidoreductase (Mqo)